MKTNNEYHDVQGPSAHNGIRWSKQELLHIGIAVAVLTLAFAIAINISPFWVGLLVAAVAVFTAFLPHELGHKRVAQRFGAWAEFRVFPLGLAVALITSFFGFVFAAPGAVYIQGRLTRKQNGLVSIAGPGINIAIAFIAIAASFLFPIGNLIGDILWAIGSLNAYLAAFNLLPIPPLDGSKVFEWNKAVWAGSIAIAALLAAVGYGLI
ncbi:MAG TPA: site-2 protease family protein [Methanomassiliicoccales archaeon]|nr:site-2 protease family protein [Methanomassiliicoccales archaeon]